MKPSRDVLMRKLAYQFLDPTLLDQALTHRSADGRNNERLEYLGDAVLGMLAAEELFKRHPRATEGELSRIRAALVKGKTLAAIAVELGLSEFLYLGPGEMKSGGARRDSILAGALEAIMGAVYLDGGLDACRELVLRLISARLEEFTPQTMRKDPKTRLQEYLQARRTPLPTYTTVNVSGAEHSQMFKVSCQVEGVDATFDGVGASRRDAEQQAAELALQHLESSGHGKTKHG